MTWNLYLEYLDGTFSGMELDWEDEATAWEDLLKTARDEYNDQEEIRRYGSGVESSEPAPPEPQGGEEKTEDLVPKLLSERTKARGRALSELYAFRTGDGTPTHPMRVTFRPDGPSVSKDPQDPESERDYRYVITLECQAWV